MGQLRHVLVHTAKPLIYAEEPGAPAEEWVEGEPGDTGPEPVVGDGFPAVLFLPTPGGEDSDRPRSKRVTRPTLLWEPVDADTGAAVPALSADAELYVRAPELAYYTGAIEARWQIDGEPQPFGPPGSVIGVQATLKRVREGGD